MMVHRFIALYEGETVAQAKIVAASSDSELVAICCRCILPKTSEPLLELIVVSSDSSAEKEEGEDYD